MDFPKNKPKWVAWLIWALLTVVEALKEMPTTTMGMTTGMFNLMQGGLDRGKNLKPPYKSVKNWSTALVIVYQIYQVVQSGGSPWGIAITGGMWLLGRIIQARP